MELAPVLASITLGVAISAPIGPVNLICVRRTLATGWPLGFVSGLGAAVADGAFAAAAASGIGLIPALLSAHLDELRLVGGLALIALGAATVLAPAPAPPLAPGATAGARGLASAFVSTFLLTLGNPVPLLALGAACAAFEIDGLHASATARVVGVLAGSALWWLVLASAVAWARGRIATRWLRFVNPVAGVAVSLFGVASLGSLWFRALSG